MLTVWPPVVCLVVYIYILSDSSPVIQNPLQRGFTEAVSSLLAAFITSEVVLNGLEDNEDVLFIVTLDAEKAFDKLNHEILFSKLYHYGIVGFSTKSRCV
jgi:hypothetical protein